VKILFVCLGNICRSPLAEGIFRDLVDKKGLNDKFTCDSSGTSGWHIGEPPDSRSELIAKKHGITLDHFGQQLSREDFENFDYIIAMDKDNFRNIKAANGFEKFNGENLLLMREFDDVAPNSDVPDPYFGGPEGFQHVYDMLNRSCNNFLEHLLEKHYIHT